MKALGVCFLLLLAGCSPQLPVGKMGSYLAQEPKRVPAKTIDFSVNPVSLNQERDMFGVMKVPFSTLLRQWSKEHFVADALEGVVRIFVDNAEIKEVPLTPKPGFFGFVASSEAKEKYVARISVVISYQYPGVPSLSPSKISVQTERHVPEGSSLQDRRYILSVLCEDVLMLLTQEVDVLLETLCSGGKR